MFFYTHECVIIFHYQSDILKIQVKHKINNYKTVLRKGIVKLSLDKTLTSIKT